MPKALLLPVSVVAEAGRRVPMARPPTAKMAAHAVAVPMAEIMHGEMPKAVAVKIMMIAVLEAAPIRSVIMPAIKSVTESGSKTAVRGATAMGDRIHLHESNGEKTSRSDGEESS